MKTPSLSSQSIRVGFPLALIGLATWYLWPRRQEASEELTAEHRWHDNPHDHIEEASWESFPASDPPGFGH